jgi:hypothetical protein
MPRITASHMLRSTMKTVSAPASSSPIKVDVPLVRIVAGIQVNFRRGAGGKVPLWRTSVAAADVISFRDPAGTRVEATSEEPVFSFFEARCSAIFERLPDQV